MAREDDIVWVYQRKDELYDWRRVDSGNSQVVSTSGGQGYVDASACEEMARALNPGVEVRRA
jgi:hypothetical protein